MDSHKEQMLRYYRNEIAKYEQEEKKEYAAALKMSIKMAKYQFDKFFSQYGLNTDDMLLNIDKSIMEIMYVKKGREYDIRKDNLGFVKLLDKGYCDLAGKIKIMNVHSLIVPIMDMYFSQYGISAYYVLDNANYTLEDMKDNDNRIDILRFMAGDNSQKKTVAEKVGYGKRQKGGRKELSTAYKRNINSTKIIKLYNDGFSMNKISKQAGCNIHTVKSRLIEYCFLLDDKGERLKKKEAHLKVP